MTRRKGEPVQIESGKWYVAGHGKPPHREECCDCGLTHRIEYRIHNGAVEYRYEVDDKATANARHRRGIKGAFPLDQVETRQSRRRSRSGNG